MNAPNHKPCLFTGERSEFDTDFSTGIAEFKSVSCGIYYVAQDASFYLHGKEQNGTHQGHLNCARKSMDVSRESEDQYALWTIRGNVENLQSAMDQEKLSQPTMPKFVACAIEDYFDEPVDHGAKPMVLLDAIGRRLEKERAFAKFIVTLEDRTWARIVDQDELGQVLQSLQDLGYLSFRCYIGDRQISNFTDQLHEASGQMTPSGWEALRARHSFPSGNKVFIATQFAWPGEQDLHGQIIQAIKRACRELGYEAEVVNQGHTGNITDRIIADIKRSRFVISELTYNNRGVYFESGFARGLDRPVFHVVRDGHTDGLDADGKRIHFDVAQVMFRKWSTPEDLEVKLLDWIESTVGRYK